MENMRHILSFYNSSDPIRLGFNANKKMSKGERTGNVFSKEALRRYATKTLVTSIATLNNDLILCNIKEVCISIKLLLPMKY